MRQFLRCAPARSTRLARAGGRQLSGCAPRVARPLAARTRASDATRRIHDSKAVTDRGTPRALPRMSRFMRPLRGPQHSNFSDALRETFMTQLEAMGVSRRSFLKVCTVAAGAVGLPAWAGEKMAEKV